MLIRLRKSHRVNAAFALVALYALCVLAPDAALAFGHGMAHCLTEATPAHVHAMRAAVPAHVHAGATVHHHDDGRAKDDDQGTAPHDSDRDGKSAGSCCGLFCASAMALEPIELMPAPITREPVRLAPVDALTGCGPLRINRPPIA